MIKGLLRTITMSLDVGDIKLTIGDGGVFRVVEKRN